MWYLDDYYDKKNDGEYKWALFVGYIDMSHWNAIWDFFINAKNSDILKDAIQVIM